jgi:hypothetical protein
MKASTLLVLVPLLGTGCTSLALERHTLNQTATLTDVRFQQVMDNLAATAANSAVLPAYAPIGEGTSLIQDTMIFDAKTLWQRANFKGFSSSTLALTGQRQPQPQWTLDPASEPQQLEAMQYALIWAVCGSPPPPCSEAERLLKHFQVYDALARMPGGWLHYGDCHDPSQKVLYRGRCGGVKVSVGPDGMQGLSAFTLIIQDIATVDLHSLDRRLAAAAVKITFKPVARFKITDQTLLGLEAGLPAGVWQVMKPKVAALKDKGFDSADAIQKALAGALDAQELKLFQNLILKLAQPTPSTTVVDTSAESAAAPLQVNPCGEAEAQQGTRTVIVTLPEYFGVGRQARFQLGSDFNVIDFTTDRVGPVEAAPRGIRSFSTVNPRQNQAK